MSERIEEAVRASARAEVEERIDPKYRDLQMKHPMELVNMTLPSLRSDAKPGDTERILDSAMARDYQEAMQKIFDREVEDVVNQRQQEVEPQLALLQRTYVMFQKNPDIVPGSKTFDKELADRFAKVAGSYTYKQNGKALGYSIDVQPLIDNIRDTLQAERKSKPDRSETQRQAVLNQPRQPNGQFDSPQQGLLSKPGRVGTGEGNNYDAFWAATPFGREPGTRI